MLTDYHTKDSDDRFRRKALTIIQTLQKRGMSVKEIAKKFDCRAYSIGLYLQTSFVSLEQAKQIVYMYADEVLDRDLNS